MTRRKTEQAVIPKSWNEVSLLLVSRVDQKTSFDNWMSQILTKRSHDQEKAWTGSNTQFMEWSLIITGTRKGQENCVSQILTKLCHDQEKAWKGSNTHAMEWSLIITGTRMG